MRSGRPLPIALAVLGSGILIGSCQELSARFAPTNLYRVETADAGYRDASIPDAGACLEFSCFWDGSSPTFNPRWGGDAGCILAYVEELPGTLVAANPDGVALLRDEIAADTDGGRWRLWRTGIGAETLGDFNSNMFNHALSIGSSGQLVGYRDGMGATRPLVSDDAGTRVLQFSVLGVGDDSVAVAVNRYGVVAGRGGSCAVEWVNDQFTPLAPATCDARSVNVYGISDDGIIVGRFWAQTPIIRSLPALWFPDGGSDVVDHYFGWSGGAVAISPSGRFIVGADYPFDAVLWVDREPVPLFVTVGVTSEVLAVNDKGWAVGREQGLPSPTTPQGKRAALWRDGARCLLNSIVDADSGFFPEEALAISGDGLIFGNAYRLSDQTNGHAFVMRLASPDGG